MNERLAEIHERLGDRWREIARGSKAAERVMCVGWMTYPPEEYGQTHALIFWKDESAEPLRVDAPRGILPDVVQTVIEEAAGMASN